MLVAEKRGGAEQQEKRDLTTKQAQVNARTLIEFAQDSEPTATIDVRHINVA